MSRLAVRTIIETWKVCDQNVSETARRLHVDRRTVKRWVDRGRQPWGYVRWQGVRRKSTAPKHPKRALRLPPKCEGREKLAVLPRLKGWRSRQFIGICNAWAWFVRSDGGLAFRTAKSCGLVTARA